MRQALKAQGFTLVEMLVVIAIIGNAMAVALASATKGAEADLTIAIDDAAPPPSPISMPGPPS